jgi:hypothetical protein
VLVFFFEPPLDAARSCAMRKLLTLSVGLLVLAVALPAFSAEREGKGKGPRVTRISGEIARADASSVTVAVKKGKEGGGKAEEQTFTLDAKTKIQVESDADETVKSEGGKEVKRAKIVDGTSADLKAGKRVIVTVADDKTATGILVPRAPAPRAGREGEKKKEAAPSTPRKSEKERGRN